MSRVIRLIGTACGIPTLHDGQFVVDYAPPAMNESGGYEQEGRLVTTRDFTQAKPFPDFEAAMNYWRQQNGLRPDGKPNRPLTAYTVEIVEADLLRAENAAT